MTPEQSTTCSSVYLGVYGEEEDQDRDGGVCSDIYCIKTGRIAYWREVCRNKKEWKKAVQEAKVH
jgi:hypothetical protein